MIKKCTHMLLKSTILGLIVFSIPLESLHGDETPWRTAQGRQCIEQWMQLVETQINASDLGPNSNLRKPWRFNKYGILLGRKAVLLMHRMISIAMKIFIIMSGHNIIAKVRIGALLALYLGDQTFHAAGNMCVNA